MSANNCNYVWNVFIDTAPLKYKIRTVLVAKPRESPMRQEWQPHSPHLQSRLLLGCNVLLLSVVPEVLVKSGSRERNAKTGILVTDCLETPLLLNHIFL